MDVFLVQGDMDRTSNVEFYPDVTSEKKLNWRGQIRFTCPKSRVSDLDLQNGLWIGPM